MVYFPPNIRDNIYAHLPLKDAITARTTLDQTFTRVIYADLKDVLAGTVNIPNFPLYWFMSRLEPRFIVGEELLIFCGKMDHTEYMVCISTDFNYILLMFRDDYHNLHVLLLQTQRHRIPGHLINTPSTYTMFYNDTMPEPNDDRGKAKAILKKHFLKNLPPFDKNEKDHLENILNPDKPENVEISKLIVSKPSRYTTVPTDPKRVLNPNGTIKSAIMLHGGTRIPLKKEIPGATIFYNLGARPVTRPGQDEDKGSVVLGIKFLTCSHTGKPIIELITSGHILLRYNSAQAGYGFLQLQHAPHDFQNYAAYDFLEDINYYWNEIYSYCVNNYDWGSKIPKYVKFFYSPGKFFITRFVGDKKGTFEVY